MTPLQTEMSDYIRLADYDRYEAGHPGYHEMMRRIVDEIVALAPKGEKAHVAEIGAGTGELTHRLGNTLRADTDAIEIDRNCAGYIRHKICSGTIINAALHANDFMTFFGSHAGEYHAAASSFSDHHFPPEKKREFLQGIVHILKQGGAYVMGDEFLPPHDETDPAQRAKAQLEYHGMIIREAFKEGKVELPGLELDALISGLRTTVAFCRQSGGSEPPIIAAGAENSYNQSGIAVLGELIAALKTISPEGNPENLDETTLPAKRAEFIARLESLQAELTSSRRAGLEEDEQNKGGDYKMTVRQYTQILKELHLKAVGFFEGPKPVGDLEEPLDKPVALDDAQHHAGGIWVLKVQLDEAGKRLDKAAIS